MIKIVKVSNRSKGCYVKLPLFKGDPSNTSVKSFESLLKTDWRTSSHPLLNSH